MRYLIPLVLFVWLVVFLAIGLGDDPREVPSPFIGKDAPSFEIATLDQPQGVISSEVLKDKVWMLNVWATWCAACRQEHGILNRLSEQTDVPLVGLNWKDEPDLARNWLRQLGNPYFAVLDDREGRLALDWGVVAAPETFVIDRNGVVRHKHVGPLTESAVKNTLLPLLKALSAETSVAPANESTRSSVVSGAASDA